MSDMRINALDARLSIIGYQPEVKRIYWSALPNTLPTFGQTLDLTGCEIKAIYADGSEAVVTDFCTFSPDTGYLVPNEQTLTVTATYTARSGKVCEADEVLPICALDHIKIIIPRTVTENIKEQAATCGSSTPTTRQYAQAFGFADVYVAAYWRQGADIVRVTKLDIDSVLSSGNFGHGANYAWGGGLLGYSMDIRSPSSNITFNRFYTPEESESVTYSYAFKLDASYTLSGHTFTDTAYLSSDKWVISEMISPPTTYTGVETFRIQSNDPNQWQLIYSETGVQPLSTIFNYLNDSGPDLYIPTGQSYVQAVHSTGTNRANIIDATLEDGAEGELRQNFIPRFKVKFSCSAGVVTWTYENY